MDAETLQTQIWAAQEPADLLRLAGAEFRLVSGNPVMREFLAAGSGAAVMKTFFESLHPVVDEDIDYVMGKLAWQVERLGAGLPKLPLRENKQAQALVAADPVLRRYVERAGSATRAANHCGRFVRDFTAFDAHADAQRFASGLRHLGMAHQGDQIKMFCALVLACKPSAIEQHGGLPTLGGAYGMSDYAHAWFGTFLTQTRRLLRAKVPVTAPDVV